MKDRSVWERACGTFKLYGVYSITRAHVDDDGSVAGLLSKNDDHCCSD